MLVDVPNNLVRFVIRILVSDTGVNHRQEVLHNHDCVRLEPFADSFHATVITYVLIGSMGFILTEEEASEELRELASENSPMWGMLENALAGLTRQNVEEGIDRVVQMLNSFSEELSPPMVENIREILLDNVRKDSTVYIGAKKKIELIWFQVADQGMNRLPDVFEDMLHPSTASMFAHTIEQAQLCVDLIENITDFNMEPPTALLQAIIW